MIKLNLEADQVMRLSCQGMGRGDWMGGVFPGSGVPKKVEWGCAAHFPKPSPYWGIPFLIDLHQPHPPPHGRQPMTQDLSEYFFKEKQDFEPL